MYDERVNFVALFLGMLLAAQSAAKPQSVPGDFAVKASFGCPSDSIDTAAGTYVRPNGNMSLATANVRLTDGERRQLFDAIDRARFFEMPAELRPQSNPDGTITVTSGTMDSLFEVTMNGKTHRVRRLESIRGNPTPELERFDALIKEVVEMYRRRREVQKLPPPLFSCL